MKVPVTAASATPQPAGREAASTAQADHRPATVAQRQLQADLNASPRQVAQRQQAAATQPRPNRTGLPDQLKAGIENLSGYSLDDVQVHYNSAKPAQLKAHAYAQGTDIHVAPGQEKHLPHEAWHVVQQKQGRVRAIRQMKGISLNDDASLEQEASLYGAKALQTGRMNGPQRTIISSAVSTSPIGYQVPTVQMNKIGDDIVPSYVSNDKSADPNTQSLIHRGLVETEIVDNKKYVRAYQTVYAGVDKGSKWKDTQQQEDGQIRFLGKGDTWINFGNPLRALHYIRTYYAQAPGKRQEALNKIPADAQKKESESEEFKRAHGRPIVRSFLVPYDTYLEVTGTAISESQREKLGGYNMNVDKSKASDQYQVMEESVQKLHNTARSGSMISYVLDELVSEYSDKSKHGNKHGQIQGIKALSDKLGLPGVFDKLTIPMRGTEVPSTEDQELHAKELSELHDLSFYMEKKQDHPKYEKLPISKQDYLSTYLRYEPRISFLTRKHLDTSILPETKIERDILRKRLASAANAAVIPKLVEENYYEGTAAMHGPKPGQSPLTDYAKKLKLDKRLLEPIVKMNTKKLSQEEIKSRRSEAEKKKEEKKLNPISEKDENGYDDENMFSLFKDSD